MKQNSYSSTFEGRKILAEFPQCISPHVFKTGGCRFFAFLKSALPEHTHEYAEERDSKQVRSAHCSGKDRLN